MNKFNKLHLTCINLCIWISYIYTRDPNRSRVQSTLYKRKTCIQKAAYISIYPLGIICLAECPLDLVLVSHKFLDLRFRCHWIIKISMINANWKMNGTISVFVSFVLTCTPQTQTHTGPCKLKAILPAKQIQYCIQCWMLNVVESWKMNFMWILNRQAI